MLTIQDVYYLICGQGKEESSLRYLAKDLGIEKYILLLGYRNDVAQLYKIAALFIFPSLQEGLLVTLMEALASGSPCIASDIRGNNDLISKKENRLFNTQDPEDILKMIKEFLSISDENLNKIKTINEQI